MQWAAQETTVTQLSQSCIARVNSVFTPFMNEMVCELLPEAEPAGGWWGGRGRVGGSLSPAVPHIRLL